MRINFDSNGEVSPDSRAAIIGVAVTYIASRIEPVRFGVMLDHVMTEFDAPEEHVGGELMSIFFLLVRIGLFCTNTADAERETSWIDADTLVWPSPSVSRFVWQQLSGADASDE